MPVQEMLMVLYITILGCGIGTFTGLVPGIHVNTMAVLLVISSASLLPFLAGICGITGLPERFSVILLGVMILSASITHSFLDFIPSLLMGVPDEEDCLSTLPAHRLLLAGDGRMALIAAAQGSLTGAMIGLMCLLPLPFLVPEAEALVRSLLPLTPWVLIAIPPLMFYAESGRAGAVIRAPPGPSRRSHKEGLGVIKGRSAIISRSLMLFLISGSLGFLAMNDLVPLQGVWDGLEGNMMLPLFSGLFALPLLLSANMGDMPPQDRGEDMDMPIGGGIKGGLVGIMVGWLPGVTATTGAMLAGLLPGRRHGGEMMFISTVAAIGTGGAIFGLATLFLVGRGRNGCLLAIKSIMDANQEVQLSAALPYLILAALIAALISHRLTMCIGRRLLGSAEGKDMSRMNRAATFLLFLLVILLSGLGGLMLFALSTLVGVLPQRFNVSRVHLTGCLLLPILLFYWNIV